VLFLNSFTAVSEDVY